MVSRNHKNKHFIHLTYKDATKIASHTYSCIEEIESEKVLSMSPKFMNSIRHGLKETLNKELFVYNSSLNGVPLAFGKIHIFKSDIIDDLECFRLKLKVTFLVFKPRLGNVLRGTVNKIADHHMGCLIHGCVNGSIRQPNLDNLSVDQKAILSNIKVGSEVLFTVTKVDNHHDILFVLGDVAPQFYSRKRKESQRAETLITKSKIKDEIDEYSINEALTNETSPRKKSKNHRCNKEATNHIDLFEINQNVESDLKSNNDNLSNLEKLKNGVCNKREKHEMKKKK